MSDDLQKVGSISAWSKVLALVAAKQASTGNRAIVATADRYSVAGGKVTAFIDWLNNATTYSQPIVATQVAEPGANAGINRPAVTWVAGTGTYTSNRAAADYSWMHNGSECTVYRVAKPNNVTTNFSLTTAAFGSGPGWDGGWRKVGANQETLLRVRNAGGSSNWLAVGASGLTDNAWNVMREEAKANGVGNVSGWTYTNGTLNSTGFQVAAPSAAAPFISATLLLAGGAGDWFCEIAIPALLTTAEKQIVSNWTRSMGLGDA